MPNKAVEPTRPAVTDRAPSSTLRASRSCGSPMTLGETLTIADTIVTASKQINPIMRIPPPLLFVVTFVAGVGLQHLARLTIPAVHILPVVGFGLVGCSVLLSMYILGTFLATRTHIDPFSSA